MNEDITGGRRYRWLLGLVDEINHVADHAGRGTRQSLLEHLSNKFGRVLADDMLAALDMSGPTVSERFQ